MTEEEIQAELAALKEARIKMLTGQQVGTITHKDRSTSFHKQTDSDRTRLDRQIRNLEDELARLTGTAPQYGRARRVVWW